MTLSISQTSKDMAMVSTECQLETIPKLLNGTIFNNLSDL